MRPDRAITPGQHRPTKRADLAGPQPRRDGQEEHHAVTGSCRRKIEMSQYAPLFSGCNHLGRAAAHMLA